MQEREAESRVSVEIPASGKSTGLGRELRHLHKTEEFCDFGVKGEKRNAL